jgi:hypothetical protein
MRIGPLNPFEQSEPFDVLQHEFLGKYVYELLDPRDQKPFYVGQGQKERVGSHFEQTRKVIASAKQGVSLKVKRITDIWKSGQLVGINVARLRLRDDAEASHVEGALLQAFNALGIEMTNEVQAPLTADHGRLDIDQVRLKAAPLVGPNRPIELVQLFKIENGIRDRVGRGMPEGSAETYFDALRRSWYRGRTTPKIGYAVGYVGAPAVSVVACNIERWEQCDVAERKWAFVRSESDDPVISELALRNWSKVIEARGGAKNYGQPAQLEFDGRGHFRFLAGASDRETWHKLD